ncbi:MAG TPA: tripartite tricarboxylate transporter TctB family protein, partial [Gudongella oleilytica]|nr:tripartite tricarboxylate transporter TctB family protein [Gudongella oleilytica]
TGLSLYILLTYLIGFYPSTVIFAVYSVVVLGEKLSARLFLFSIGLVLVLWILFGTIFRVTLP